MDHDLEANGWRQRAFPASWPSLVITADRVCFADQVCVCTDTSRLGKFCGKVSWCRPRRSKKGGAPPCSWRVASGAVTASSSRGGEKQKPKQPKRTYRES